MLANMCVFRESMKERKLRALKAVSGQSSFPVRNLYCMAAGAAAFAWHSYAILHLLKSCKEAVQEEQVEQQQHYCLMPFDLPVAIHRNHEQNGGNYHGDYWECG